MSEKITPIQALENIKERLKQDGIIHLLDMCNLIVVEKSLKALEIIKNHIDLDVAIRWGTEQPMLMLKSKKPHDYLYIEIPVSKEEYELLKEILK